MTTVRDEIFARVCVKYAYSGAASTSVAIDEIAGTFHACGTYVGCTPEKCVRHRSAARADVERIVDAELKEALEQEDVPMDAAPDLDTSYSNVAVRLSEMLWGGLAPTDVDDLNVLSGRIGYDDFENYVDAESAEIEEFIKEVADLAADQLSSYHA